MVCLSVVYATGAVPSTFLPSILVSAHIEWESSGLCENPFSVMIFTSASGTTALVWSLNAGSAMTTSILPVRRCVCVCGGGVYFSRDHRAFPKLPRPHLERQLLLSSRQAW